MKRFHHDWRHRIVYLAVAACALFSVMLPMAQADNGVRDREIFFGQSTALTGPLAELGLDSSTAAKAYFDYINSNGGVHGRTIRLLTLDDRYDTKQGVVNAKRLIDQEKVFALFNVISTSTNIALLPIITEANIPNIAPYSGAEALRKPFNRLIFHVRASYADEVNKIIEHLTVRGISRIGVVYQNNAFGKAGLASVESSVVKHKMTLVVATPIETDASDADFAAKKMADGKPKAILMITAGTPSAAFVKAYNRTTVGMQFFAISVMGSQTSITALGAEGAGLVVSQVGAFPFFANSAMERNYQKIMKKMGVKTLSFAGMEGFIDAVVTVEGLRRAGRELTRERFIQALESMNDVDLDGYQIKFSKDNHEGSRFVDLTVIAKGGRFVR